MPQKMTSQDFSAMLRAIADQIDSGVVVPRDFTMNNELKDVEQFGSYPELMPTGRRTFHLVIVDVADEAAYQKAVLAGPGRFRLQAGSPI